MRTAKSHAVGRATPQLRFTAYLARTFLKRRLDWAVQSCFDTLKATETIPPFPTAGQSRTPLLPAEPVCRTAEEGHGGGANSVALGDIRGTCAHCAFRSPVQRGTAGCEVCPFTSDSSAGLWLD